MSTAIKEARRVQIGKESTRGDPVAATRAISMRDPTYRIIEEMEEFEGQMHRTMARVATAPVVVRTGTEFEFASWLDFDQILMFCLSGLKGGVSPATPGTGDARLWTFRPPIAADPLPDTYTLEFSDRDMDASPNELSNESPYCFTTVIEITGGIDGVVEITASMVGRKAVIAASTAALALPTLEFMPQLKWTIDVDPAWASLGSTQISGQIYGFTWRFEGYLRPVAYNDGRGDLDFSQYEFAPRTADLSLDVTIDPSGFVAAEDGNKTVGTPRFVRLEIEGSAFDTPDDSFNKMLRIDGCYYHRADSMTERGNDRDGSASTRMHLSSAYDVTEGADVEVVVQNALTAFP